LAGCFTVPAFAGGIFGLLGGYLTDRLGRRRVLTYSILIYAVAAFLSGFSSSIEMLLLLRCFVFIGVCVEFVAAVAWLAELFPEATRREKVLGYTQAFSSLGGILVATANGLCIAVCGQSAVLESVRLLDSRSPCAVALYADVGRAACDSADSHPDRSCRNHRRGSRRKPPVRWGGRASLHLLTRASTHDRS
jgi:MFS family permease